MIFRTLRMKGFRKFVDQTIHFGPALNLLIGPNESGKSTVHHGILAALYGLSPERSRVPETVSKSSAISWHTDRNCVLELEYECAGITYRLVRDLSAGVAELHRRANGNGDWTMLSDTPKGVARRISEQTRIHSVAVFNRTVSVRQSDMAEIRGLKEIGKTVEALLTGSLRTTPHEAKIYIEKNYLTALKKRDKRNKPGKIDELEDRLRNLEEESCRVEECSRRRDECRERLRDLETRLPESEKRHDHLTALLDKAKERQQLLDDSEKAREQLEVLQARLERGQLLTEKIAALRNSRLQIDPAGNLDSTQIGDDLRKIKERRVSLDKHKTANRTRTESLRQQVSKATALEMELEQKSEELKALGRVSEADIDALKAALEEALGKSREESRKIEDVNKRLDEMRAALATAQNQLDTQPDLADASSVEEGWHRKRVLVDEKEKSLAIISEELKTAKETQSGRGSYGNLLIILGVIVLVTGAVLGFTVSLWFFVVMGSGALILGADVFLAVLNSVAVKKNIVVEEKRQEEVKAELRSLKEELSTLLSDLGVSENELPDLIRHVRDIQTRRKTLNHDIEQLETRKGGLEEASSAASDALCALAAKWEYSSPESLAQKLEQAAVIHDQRGDIVTHMRGVVGVSRDDSPVAELQQLRGTLEELEREADALDTEEEQIVSEEGMLLEKLGVRSVDEASARLRELQALRNSIEKETRECEGVLMENSLDSLKGFVEELQLRTGRIEIVLRNDFADFAPDLDQTESWRLERERVSKRIQETKSEIDKVRGQLNQLTETNIPPLEVLLGEKDYTKSEIARHQCTLKAAERAIEVLDNIQQKPAHLPIVEKAASRHIEILTDGRYRHVIVSAAWDRIDIEDANGRRIEPGQLSAGTIDQLYFAFRLAAIESFGEGEHLPLLLDDPFVNCDAERFELAMQTVLALAHSGTQVIYFTLDEEIASCSTEWQQNGLDVTLTTLRRDPS